MTSMPSRGRGGDAESALSRLKNKGRLSKASSGSVVSDMVGSVPVGEPKPVSVETVELDAAPSQLSQKQPAASPSPPTVPDRKPAQQEAEVKPKSRRKMSLTPTEDEHDQIRQTFMATRHIHRFASLNDFLRSCVLQEIARLETEYNDGQPFEYRGAEIPKGRPLKF